VFRDVASALYHVNTAESITAGIPTTPTNQVTPISSCHYDKQYCPEASTWIVKAEKILKPAVFFSLRDATHYFVLYVK
jgi:hypothetical protein